MSSDVESLVQQRQQWLRNSLIGLPLWLGAMILQDALPMNRGVSALLSLVLVVGGSIWGVALWRITQMTKRMQGDRRLSNALNDERTQMDRFKAALFALVAICVVQMVAISVLAFAPNLIRAGVLAEVNILVATTAFVGAFLHLDKQE